MFNFRRRTTAELAAEAGLPVSSKAPTRPGQLLKRLFGFRLREAQPPARFSRIELAKGVNLFSAQRAATNLIVGFTTKHGLLMVPASLILQELDDAAHDLLLLTDPRRLFFNDGIEGFAPSLPELMKKIADVAQRRGYRSIITYGTSMGGFPALRAGDLIGAARSISVGGRFVWHPDGLSKGKPVGAFDSLCDCRVPLRTSCYMLYSGGSREDVEHAAMLSAIAPACHRIELPSAKHNFPKIMQERGTLGTFHAQMFDLSREPDPARLSALLA